MEVSNKEHNSPTHLACLIPVNVYRLLIRFSENIKIVHPSFHLLLDLVPPCKNFGHIQSSVQVAKSDSEHADVSDTHISHLAEITDTFSRDLMLHCKTVVEHR